MSKKSKKRQESRRRYSEKKRRYARLFDIAALGVLAVIVICAMILYKADCPVADASGAGFAGWFLLVFGYIPLLVYGMVNAVAGMPQIMPDPAGVWFLAGADAVMLAVIWTVVRVLCKRRPPDFTRCAWHILMLILYWGIFQLCCCAVFTLNHHNGIAEDEGNIFPAAEVAAEKSGQ